jgi:hypothetical protein
MPEDKELGHREELFDLGQIFRMDLGQFALGRFVSLPTSEDA